ncbi:uncharacterized protein [Antedon mediterranea]|uniref:uncharacterized protein n=1 Tax=Antedon mediterranea TaxID=105859 RepID=UPI003AF60429
MDRYVKKKKIGEGSFGKALLVKSKANGKEYVIKEINISKMKRKEREESKKEVAVLKQMKHPNIVSYQESFEELGNLYIVMDYCDGGDLYKAINCQRGILFDEDKVIDWFVQISLAIKHVHDRKILHRDLKSQNIFLTRKGIIKLGDFGIARVLNNTMELARTCIGTPYYLSPEIVENRPYNNKSDIWALGCVLYELCTLKHAFEAGNMKNLVLKIIRGSYPPVSPRYSYELRNLVALLFKRNPRDRPSINSILKKPLIQKRIQRFLTETQSLDEFSHTIIHRKRPGAPTVGGGRPVMVPPVRKAVQPVRVSNPSAKYGVSVAAKKPPSAAAKRVPAHKIMDNKELEKKKHELMAKERDRRNQNLQVRARQQKLADKQRMDRMNRAREGGWKNTLTSSEGSTDEKQINEEPPRKEAKLNDGGERQWVEPKPVKQERGKYDHYHDRLDELKQGAKVEPAFGGVAYKRQAEDNAWPDQQQIREQIRNRPVSASAAEAARRAAENRAFAANAANKGKEAQEFWERKRQAAMNKAKANAQIMGLADRGAAKPKENQQANRQHAYHNKDEQDYLERLKAIRVQNYNERRQIQKQAIAGGVKASLGDPRVDPEARRKKIEALKAQADQRAAKLKEDLARKRQEAYEKEKQQREEQARKNEGGHRAFAYVRAVNQPAIRAVNQPAVRAVDQPTIKPVAVKGPVAQVLGITDALRQIKSDEGVEVQTKERQNEIEQNQKVPERRKHWNAGDAKAFENMPLEVTASDMEATGIADAVVKHDQGKERKNIGNGRKQWGGHGDTVVNALQGRQLAVETQIISPLKQGSPMGVTVVKDSDKPQAQKPPIQPGTIIIMKEKEKSTDNTDEDSIETISAVETKPETREAVEEKPKGHSAWDNSNKGDNSPKQSDDKSDVDNKNYSIKKTNTPRSARPSWERKLNQSDGTNDDKADSLNASGRPKSPRDPIPPWQRKSYEGKPTAAKKEDNDSLSVSLDGKGSKSPRSMIPPWQRKSLPEENHTDADGLKKSPAVDADSKSPRPLPERPTNDSSARKRENLEQNIPDGEIKQARLESRIVNNLEISHSCEVEKTSVGLADQQSEVVNREESMLRSLIDSEGIKDDDPNLISLGKTLSEKELKEMLEKVLLDKFLEEVVDDFSSTGDVSSEKSVNAGKSEPSLVKATDVSGLNERSRLSLINEDDGTVSVVVDENQIEVVSNKVVVLEVGQNSSANQTYKLKSSISQNTWPSRTEKTRTTDRQNKKVLSVNQRRRKRKAVISHIVESNLDSSKYCKEVLHSKLRNQNKQTTSIACQTIPETSCSSTQTNLTEKTTLGHKKTMHSNVLKNRKSNSQNLSPVATHPLDILGEFDTEEPPMATNSSDVNVSSIRASNINIHPLKVDDQDTDFIAVGEVKSSDVTTSSKVSVKDVFACLNDESDELQTFFKKDTSSGELLGLINQVDLEEDEGADVEDIESSPPNALGGSKLLSGLQTGHFDTDVRILRTCSEPDLCKLFRTTLAMNPFLEIHDGQVEDDIQLEDANDVVEGNEEEEEEEDEVIDEDDLYQSMLENMESVLTHMDEKNGNEAKNELENDVVEHVEGGVKPEESDAASVDAVAAATNDDDDDDDGESGQVINEDWDSGDGEDDDILEKDDDLFCRLEESRVELEQELGCETFLQVYKSIQAIHEDEDENIEEGTQIANKLLGKEKTHLYPKIFQLVMADSAFTESKFSNLIQHLFRPKSNINIYT